MKKWTAITDGGKYGVQPTMEKPEDFERWVKYKTIGWTDWYVGVCKEYESHLLTLPRYLRTQGLELLPDGSEFEARLQYQCDCWCGYWVNCTKDVYDSEVDVNRRIVLAACNSNVCGYCDGKGWYINEDHKDYPSTQQKLDCYHCSPLVKDETEYLLSGNNGERLKESIGQLSTPEPVEQEEAEFEEVYDIIADGMRNDLSPKKITSKLMEKFLLTPK